MRAESAAPMALRYGHVTVLRGARNGKYPEGNSLLVAGREAGKA